MATQLNTTELDFKKIKDNLKSYLKNSDSSFKDYDLNRNDPTKNALSNLSPYFHYGHLSSQRAILEIKKFNLPQIDKDAFIEQVLIRKELADNFCEFEKNYDFFEGFHPWAKKTLDEHKQERVKLGLESEVLSYNLTEKLMDQIKTKIRTGASPKHVPAKIISVKDIPRTKSGKIAELAVRDLIHNKPINNITALANPECLEEYKNIKELSA